MEFERKVPCTLQIMVEADKLLRATGNTINGGSAVINAYRLVGQLLTQADGSVHENERRDLEIYLNMIEAYQEENGGDPSSSATGFTKVPLNQSPDTVDAPPKG